MFGNSPFRMVAMHLPELDPRAHDEVDGPRGHKQEDVADDVARWNRDGLHYPIS